MKPPIFPGKQQRGKKKGQSLVPMQVKVPLAFKLGLAEFAHRQLGHPPVNAVIEETFYQVYPELRKRVKQIAKELENETKKQSLDGIIRQNAIRKEVEGV